MGEDRERDQQISNGDVGRDSHRGKTETDTKFDVIFFDDSSAVSWAEMNRRGTRKIRQKLSGSIEIDDQIATTWWHSTSRRWRSSQIPRLGINISFRIYVFFALVNSNMAKFLAKRRWKLHTEYTSWSVHNTLFLREHMTAHSVAQVIKVKTFARHAHCPALSLLHNFFVERPVTSVPSCVVLTFGSILKTLCVYHLSCKRSVQQPKRARPLEWVWPNGWLSPKHGIKKRFQCCVDPYSTGTVLHLRAMENTLILHCKTTCCYRTTSPNISITLEAPMTYTPSSNLDWFRVEKCQEREACGVLHSRKSDVRWSAQRSRARPDEAQNCSVQKQLDPEDTPINIPDSHHDFLCPDHVTMIPTSPEGSPNFEAFSSSQKSRS